MYAIHFPAKFQNSKCYNMWLFFHFFFLRKRGIIQIRNCHCHLSFVARRRRTKEAGLNRYIEHASDLSGLIGLTPYLFESHIFIFHRVTRSKAKNPYAWNWFMADGKNENERNRKEQCVKINNMAHFSFSDFISCVFIYLSKYKTFLYPKERPRLICMLYGCAVERSAFRITIDIIIR